tara:strand:+ start:16708 stop:17220 length:513 start_codon:yes stop_codon:yes gene_type:complete
MKHSLWIAVAIVALIAGVWFYDTRHTAPPAPEPTRRLKPPPPSFYDPSEPDPRNPTSPLARTLNRPDHSAQRDLEIVYTLLFQTRQFVKDLPSRPLGTNAEFTAVLTGDNSLQLAAIPPNHPAVNESGELTDRWGTPFLFHPVSSSETTLRSAGPDQQLFTDDDLVYPEE